MKTPSQELDDKVTFIDSEWGIGVWSFTQAEVETVIRHLDRVLSLMVKEGVAILPDCPEE